MTIFITNEGKKVGLNRLIKASPTYTQPDSYKIGSGIVNPNFLSINISNPVPIGAETTINNMDATTNWTAGVDSAVSLNTTTKYEGTGALNITKSGTSGQSFSIYNGSLTSTDLTGRTARVYVYIKDSTAYNKLQTNNCLLVLIGNDLANSYYWTFNKVDLSQAVGNWYGVSLDLLNPAGSNGSPVISSIDFCLINFSLTNSSDTTSAGDFIADKLCYFTTLTSLGTVTLNETDITSTVRCEIGTTVSNSINLTEFSIFNNQNMMYSAVSHPAYAKTSGFSLVYYWKEVVR